MSDQEIFVLTYTDEKKRTVVIHFKGIVMGEALRLFEDMRFRIALGQIITEEQGHELGPVDVTVVSNQGVLAFHKGPPDELTTTAEELLHSMNEPFSDAEVISEEYFTDLTQELLNLLNKGIIGCRNPSCPGCLTGLVHATVLISRGSKLPNKLLRYEKHARLLLSRIENRQLEGLVIQESIAVCAVYLDRQQNKGKYN